MKRPASLFPWLLVVTLTAVAGLTATLAQSGHLSPIRIVVSPTDQTTHGEASQKSSARSETKTEYLAITLQNVSRQKYENLLVRYCIFDQDIEDQTIGVALSKEKTMTVPAGSMLTFTSEVASVTYTPGHAGKPKSTGKSGASTVKKTAGKSPNKEKEFAGYAVQLVQTNVVIGQLFNPIDLTNESATAFGGSAKAAH